MYMGTTSATLSGIQSHDHIWLSHPLCLIKTRIRDVLPIEVSLHSASHNMPSAMEHPMMVTEYLLKEFSLG